MGKAATAIDGAAGFPTHFSTDPVMAGADVGDENDNQQRYERFTDEAMNPWMKHDEPMLLIYNSHQRLNAIVYIGNIYVIDRGNICNNRIISIFMTAKYLGYNMLSYV